MNIATMGFERLDADVDWDTTDVFGLQETVLVALDRHFGTFNEAAGAQMAHRRVKAAVENDPTLNLFSINDTFRAAVHADTRALQWESFVRAATSEIAPFCFSIRFSA